MTLTIEFYGHTFTLALNRDEPEAEPIHPSGDVFSDTERRPSLGYDDRTSIGFITSKGRS